jgi:hypothetical protein
VKNDAEVRAARRETAALREVDRGSRRGEEPSEVDAQIEPTQLHPPRPFSSILATFMEEKHIRWGELVGGLLIVSCSIALVVTFWSQIAERPLLKFGVFNGVTAGLFALGLHAAKHWKLPTTSQGLLLIGMLLVPLNFLAIAAFTEGAAANSPLVLGGELLSMVIFSVLVWGAARELTPQFPISLSLGVLLPSVSQLLLRRFIGPETTSAVLYGAATGVQTLYIASQGKPVWSARTLVGEEKFPKRIAQQMLKCLGVCSFVVCLTLGFLHFRTEQPGATLRQLAPLGGLLCLPMLAIGTALRQRGSPRSNLPTVGTTLIALSTLVLLGSLAMSWPRPLPLMCSAGITFAILTAIGVLLNIGEAHWIAAGAAVLLFALSVNFATGKIDSASNSAVLATALSSGFTGNVLGLLGIAYLVVAGRVRKLFVVALGIFALSLILISYRNFGVLGDPGGATWMYLLYAVGGLLALALKPSGWSSGVFGVLLLASIAQGMVFRWGHGSWGSLLRSADHFLLHSTFTLGLGFFAWYPRTMRALEVGRQSLRQFLNQCNIAHPTSSEEGNKTYTYLSSVGAVSLVAGCCPLSNGLVTGLRELSSGYFFWWSLLALGLTILHRSVTWFTLFQWGTLAGLLLSTLHWAMGRTWYGEVPHGLGYLHPIALQAIGVCLVGFASLLVATRWIVRRRKRVSGWTEKSVPQSFVERCLYPPWPRVDSVALVGATCLLVGLAVYGTAPGIGQELVLRPVAWDRVEPPLTTFELLGVPHAPASGLGTWIVLTFVGSTLVGSLLTEYRIRTLVGLSCATAAGCLLLAACFESQCAVASGLRWISAFAFAGGSFLLWRFHHYGTKRQTLRHGFYFLLAVLCGPALAMALTVCASTIRLVSLDVNSLWMWLAMGIAALVVVPLWFVNASAQTTSSVARSKGWMPTLAPSVMNTILLLGVAPLIAITLHVVVTGLGQHPIVGPRPDSIFSLMGLVISYSVPLGVIALTMVGHALYQHSARLALVAGLTINVCATTAFLLGAKGMDLTAISVRLAQWNALISALFAIAWIGYLRRRRREASGSVTEILPLTTYLGFSVGCLSMYIFPLAIWLFLVPNSRFPFEIAGGSLGWSASLSCLLAMIIRRDRLEGAARLGEIKSRHDVAEDTGWRSISLIRMPLLFAGVLVAFDLHRWDTGNWYSYHALMIVIAVLGFLAPWRLLEEEREESVFGEVPRRTTLRLTKLYLVTTIILAVRAILGDPLGPWWSCGGFFAAAGISVLHARQLPSRAYLYLAAVLINLAVSVGWIEAWHRYFPSSFGVDLCHFGLVNVFACTAPTVLWRWLDGRWINRIDAHSPTALRLIGLHRVTSKAGLVVVAWIILASLLHDVNGDPLTIDARLLWSAMASMTISVIVCLWDRESRWSLLGLYATGLVIAAATVDAFNLSPRLIVWFGTVILAAYSLITSYLGGRHQSLQQMGRLLGIPQRIPDGNAESRGNFGWLVVANLLLASFVVVLGFMIQFLFRHSEYGFRFAGAKCVIIQALAIGLLARGTRLSGETSERLGVLRTWSLWIGVAGAIAFSWTFIDGSAVTSLLNRLVATSTALAAMVAVYGLIFAKILRVENLWTQSAKGLLPILGGMSLTTLLATLLVELGLYATYGRAEMHPVASAAVLFALIGLAVTSILAAVIPGRDPLGLSESRRQVYVYLAESLLGLAFLHLRLTVPELFTGRIRNYWPLIIMGIAFLGVGLSEFFRRRNVRVIAEPMERTGVLLPMLPVLGYWMAPGQVHYSLIMLVVGVLYGTLSAMRRSFGFGILSALAVNGGLWYLLHDSSSLGILKHPQLWLIPPSLCVLLAGYLHRGQLSPSQQVNLRFLASTVIYTSSTADVFLNGVAQNPWLPGVLALLSLTGIAAGMMLRVRAFLFLGTAFLGLSLLTVIWYAAVDLHQTWIWFVSGILAGVTIIGMFGLFERKRHELLEMAGRLKSWD